MVTGDNDVLCVQTVKQDKLWKWLLKCMKTDQGGV